MPETPSPQARRPIAAERRQLLLELYQRQGVVTLVEARELFALPDETIRRDLSWLAQRTRARRVYGGVIRPLVGG